MNILPLISVIIPVYNIKEYLPRCVHSVTAQTFQNLEVLLIDDGSTDGTGALCDELAKEDARIRVFHKENGGSSSARNLGLSVMQGEYVGFVDSDDFIEADMYERLLMALQATGAGIAQTGRNEIDAEGNHLPDICVPPEKQERIPARDFMKELLMHRGDCSFCTKLIRSDLMKEYRFPEGKLNEDFWLLIQMLPEAQEVISLPGYGYHVFYRIGSNSRKADKNDFSRVYGDCVDNADFAMELVKERWPELVETALRFGVFQRLEYLLHIPIPMMTGENRQYQEIVSFLRKHWGESMKNSLLTRKNKIYHTLFAVCPRGIRVVHKTVKHL